MLALLTVPFVSLAVAASGPLPTSADPVMTPRIAQVRLAETLASADAIDWIRVNDDHVITVAMARAGHRYRVFARTNSGDRVIAFAIEEIERELVTGTRQLDWLAPELRDTTSVTHVVIEPGRPVELVTNDDRHYLAIADQGANTAVEARWAAAWDRQ